MAGGENHLVIAEKECLFLNGKELKNVLNYKIEHSARKPAELTVTIEVLINSVGSESEK